MSPVQITFVILTYVVFGVFEHSWGKSPVGLCPVLHSGFPVCICAVPSQGTTFYKNFMMNSFKSYISTLEREITNLSVFTVCYTTPFKDNQTGHTGERYHKLELRPQQAKWLVAFIKFCAYKGIIRYLQRQYVFVLKRFEFVGEPADLSILITMFLNIAGEKEHLIDKTIAMGFLRVFKKLSFREFEDVMVDRFAEYTYVYTFCFDGDRECVVFDHKPTPDEKILYIRRRYDGFSMDMSNTQFKKYIRTLVHGDEDPFTLVERTRVTRVVEEEKVGESVVAANMISAPVLARTSNPDYSWDHFDAKAEPQPVAPLSEVFEDLSLNEDAEEAPEVQSISSLSPEKVEVAFPLLYGNSNPDYLDEVKVEPVTPLSDVLGISPRHSDEDAYLGHLLSNLPGLNSRQRRRLRRAGTDVPYANTESKEIRVDCSVSPCFRIRPLLRRRSRCSVTEVPCANTEAWTPFGSLDEQPWNPEEEQKGYEPIGNSDEDKEDDNSVWNFQNLSIFTDMFSTVADVFPNNDNSNYITWASSISSYVYQLYRSRGYGDYFAATIQFANVWLSHQQAVALGNKLKASIRLLSGKLNLFRPDARPVNESGFLDCFGLLSSNLGTFIRRVAFAVASTSMLGSDLSDKFKRWLGPAGPLSVLGLLAVFFEVVSYMHKFATLFLNGGSFMECLTAEDPVVTAMKESTLLLNKRSEIYTGIPVPGKMDRNTYVGEIHKYLQFFRDALKRSPPGGYERRKIEQRISELHSVFNGINAAIRGQQRQAPLVWVVCGPPGIGKSRIVSELAKLWCRIRGLKYSPGVVYTKPKTSAYWEGYDPFSQPIIHFSEVGNVKARIAANNSDEVRLLQDIQSLTDNLGFPCDMAFDGKGNSWAFPEVLIIDTNVATMGIPEIMSAPAALLRRLTFINPTVLERYRKVVNGVQTMALDSALSLADKSSPIIERYKWSLIDHVALDNHKYIENPQRYYSFASLSRELATRAYKHLILQDQLAMETPVVCNEQSHVTITQWFKSKFLPPPLEEDGEVVFPYSDLDDAIVDKEAVLDFLSLQGFDLPGEEKELPVVAELDDIRDVFDEILNYDEKGDVPDGDDPNSGDPLDVHFAFHEVGEAQPRETWFSWFLRVSTHYKLDLFLGFVLFAILHWFYKVNVHIRTNKSLEFFLFFICFVWIRSLFAAFIFAVFCYFPADACFDYFMGAQIEKRTTALWERATRFRRAITEGNYVYYGAGACAAWLMASKLARTAARAQAAFSKESASEYVESVEESIEADIHNRVRFKKTNIAWDSYGLITPLNNITPCKETAESLFKSTLKSNVQFAEVHCANTPGRMTHIFGIKDSYWLINSHVVNALPVKLIIKNSRHDRGGRNFDLPANYFYDLGNDLTMVYIPGLRCRDFIKHIATDTPNNFKGWFVDSPVECIKIPKVYTKDPIAGESEIVKPFSLKYDRHAPGLCGTPLVGLIGRNCTAIVGIHAAGLEGVAYSTPITAELVLRGIGILNELAFIDKALKRVPSEGAWSNLVPEPPTSKSPSRFLNLYNLEYYGKVPGATCVKRKSKLKRSLFSVELDDFFKTHFNFERTEVFCEPTMRPKTVDGVYISPVNIALNKMDNTPPVLNTRILTRVVDEIVERVVSGLREKGITKISPVSLDNAINGVVKDQYSGRLNMKASAGFGFPGKKGKYFTRKEDDSGWIADELVLTRVAEIFEDYDNGVPQRYIFTSQLKDEPRLKEKAENGSTRLFFMAPLDLLVVSNMFLSPLYSLMPENPEIFATAVGCDAFTDVEKLFVPLKSHSKNFVEFDYSGYDVSSPFQIAEAASAVTLRIAQEMGYNSKALTFLGMLLKDLLYPVINVENDLYVKPGMQPSGKLGTAEDNSNRNLIMIMYIYYSIPELWDTDFFTEVLLSTYGDDVIGSVSELASQYFDNFVYKDLCWEFFNMKVTPASKGDAFVQFLTFEQLSFLRRNFVQRDGYWLAPLNLNSLYKMLEWVMPSENMTEEMQVYQTMNSFLYEAFLHLDADAYHRVRDHLLKIFRLHYSCSTQGFASLPGYSAISVKIYGKICEKRGTPFEHSTMIENYEEKDCRNAEEEDFVTPCAYTESEVKMNDPSHEDVFENLRDDGGEEAKYSGTSSSPTLNIGQRHTLRLDNFLSRPVEIASGSMAVGTQVNEVIPVWDLFSRHPSVRAKLRNYAYFRGDLGLRIIISGSPFHYGKILASYQPYPTRNEALAASLARDTATVGVTRPCTLNYLSQAREKVYCDVRENAPYDMRIPFISPKPSHRLYNTSVFPLASGDPYDDFENAGSLFLYTINSVETSSTGVVSDVYWRIYVHAIDPELGCTTGSMTVVDTESGFIDKKDERRVGPIERITTAVASGMKMFSQVPYVGDEFKRASDFASYLGGAASVYGFSKPVNGNMADYVKNRPYNNGAEIIGTETSKRVVLDPKQELIVGTGLVGVDEDEMVIAVMAAKETLLITFPWTEADPVMSNPIRCFGVSPQISTVLTPGLTTYVQPTPAAFAATPFGYWRGKVKFRFEIVVSAFHRGKLLFMYEPNVCQDAAINANISLNKNFVEIVDLQDTTEFEFCVDWAAPRAWLRNLPPSNLLNLELVSDGDFANPLSLWPYVNGYIAVTPFTELQSPNGSSAYVNVYVSVEDLHVNQLHDSQFVTKRIPNESGFINPTGASDEHISMHHFGEEPLTFRNLVKRFANRRNLNLAPGVGDMIRFETYIYPVPLPNYAGATGSQILLHYLPLAFMASRGSVRYRLSLHTGSAGVTDFSRVVVSLGGLADFITPTTAVFATGIPAPNSRGSVAFVPSTNGGVEFELPFYSSNLFNFSFCTDYIGAGNHVNEMVDTWTKQFIVQATITDATQPVNWVSIDIAAGEDFAFMRFTGAPYYTI